MGCLGTPSPKAFQWLLKGSDIPPLRRDQKTRRAPSASCRRGTYSHLASRKPAYSCSSRLQERHLRRACPQSAPGPISTKAPQEIGEYTPLFGLQGPTSAIAGSVQIRWPKIHSDWNARSEIKITSRMHSLQNIVLKGVQKPSVHSIWNILRSLPEITFRLEWNQRGLGMCFAM